MVEPKYVVNYFMEFLVSLNLKIFGNNYYGLRMASVLSGAMILFVVYLILKEYFKNEKKGIFFILLALLYMIFDFSFLLSNKVAEPTIFRLLAFGSVCYVYTTNFFIIPAVGIYVLLMLISEDYKKAIFSFIFYILGLMIAGLVFFLFF